MKVPNKVKCEITGVEHYIVDGEKNIDEIKNYLIQTISRLQKNEHIFIAIDCEGFCLGTKEKSLGLIQFAECFSSNFLKTIPKLNKREKIKRCVPEEKKISINLKPGFMIMTPINNEVNDMMSVIFQHENTTLIFFDITSDLVSMTEIGLCFNENNIIDAQPSRPVDGIANFADPRVEGLKRVCSNAYNCVEFEKAENALKRKSFISFEEIYYKFKDKESPFREMLNDEFWQYSASDIALTAISLVSRLSNREFYNITEASHNKVKEFFKLQREFGHFAPSLLRSFSFFKPKLMEKRIRNKQDAYKNIFVYDNILRNWEYYTKLIKKKRVKKERVIQFREKSYKYIEKSNTILGIPLNFLKYIFMLILLTLFILFKYL